MKRKSEALPGEARITKKTDFERIKREGVWIRGEHFDVIFARGPEKCARLGVIVPLYSQNVVARNLLKRRIKEVMRRVVLPKMPGQCDIVVRVRKKAYETTYETIREELVKIAMRHSEKNPETTDENR